MTQSVTAPVRNSVTVKAPRARAFDVFTRRIGSWWLAGHHIAPEPFVDVVIEPRVDGRWFERSASGAECDWGRVLVWEPPERLVLAWQLTADFTYDPSFQTEVEVRFVEVDASTTRVELEHRDLDRYGDAADRTRTALDSDGGWRALVASFAAFADAQTS